MKYQWNFNAVEKFIHVGKEFGLEGAEQLAFVEKHNNNNNNNNKYIFIARILSSAKRFTMLLVKK